MKTPIMDLITFIAETAFFIYAVVVMSGYVILAIISGITLRKYMKKNSFVDYSAILSSSLAPSITIIAPAYNESLTIESNIRALLSLFYHKFEVIIVNDGSKDDSLEKMINTYELEKVNYAINYKIPCNTIRGVYKSKRESHYNLTVVDKENGGKADALNAGINIARNDYIVAIDVDSIIQSDALLKLTKPFLEETDHRIIATGGVVRIANSCVIEGGQILKVNLPWKVLPAFQVLEYTRAFLMGRMAWSKLNGLLLISGALGLFDKQIVIACGGYYHKTVGEDMELVVRMRRYMAERNQKFRVAYIPDPLLWTEAPDSLNILGRQRNRWTRGTIDTLLLHRKLFFNYKYGLMGMLSYPFWLFFEWLAPLIEVAGLVYFILIIIFGDPNWPFILTMLAFVYAFAVLLSTYAILFEELTYHRYEKKTDVIRLFLLVWIEPFTYHPMNVWWALRGNWDYFIRKKSGWGSMVRKGFSSK